MKRNNRLALAAVGLGLVTALLGAGVASADPSGTPPATGNLRVLQGGGSDTTEEVMNALSETVVSDGSVGLPPAGDKMMASWNATGGAFQSRASGCNFNASATGTWVSPNRPNGSGQGVAALKAAFTSGHQIEGCLDFARSSGNGSGTNTPQLAYIPFAKDAVAFAVSSTSTISRNLTLADLQSIYHCTYDGFTGATPTKKALLPQAGSGTRSFWIGKMGITETDIANGVYPCISDRTDFNGVSGGTKIQEHRGNVLKSNQIVPISIAQYNAQAAGISTDFRGTSVLGSLVDNSSAPTLFSHAFAMNTSYSNVGSGATLTRDVYNVVPVSSLSDPDVNYVFTDNDGAGADTSALCNASSVITKFGFGLISNCGITTNVF